MKWLALLGRYYDALSLHVVPKSIEELFAHFVIRLFYLHEGLGVHRKSFVARYPRSKVQIEIPVPGILGEA